MIPKNIKLTRENLARTIEDIGSEYIIFKGEYFNDIINVHVVMKKQTAIDIFGRTPYCSTIKIPFSYEEWGHKTLKQLVDFTNQFISSINLFYK